MKKASRIIAGFAALGFAVSACGDDEGGSTGTNSGDQLSATEGLAIFTALQTALAGGLATPMATAAIPVDGSANCPGGGSISLSGDVDADGSSITFDITETISGCIVSSGGVNFTINGDPNIRIQGDLDVNTTTFATTGTFAMSGGFTYTSDDSRSGSCSISINFDYGDLSVSGSICGTSITG